MAERLRAARNTVARMPRSRTAVLVGAIVALLWTAAPPPAHAQDAAQVDDDGAEALGIDVTTGYGDVAVDGPWMPVAVRMAPRRPVLATLDVSARGSDGEQTQSREIELRGGATAVYRFVVPTGAVRVTVREAGEPAVTVRVPGPEPSQGNAVIGLLGSTAEPPPVTDTVTGRSARWAPLDPGWLAFGTPALRPLSAVVVDQTALTELDDRARRSLAAAVTAGMDLVITATTPGPVDLEGIGDARTIEVGEGSDDADLRSLHVDGPAWQVAAADVWPDGDARTTVAVSMASGRGRVNVATVAPGPGPIAGATRLWSLLALGRAPRGSFDEMRFNGGATGTAAQLSLALSDGAEPAPAIPWLAAFLVAYIVVVGPVCGTILARRRRRELTWVAVPAVTVVFTLAAALAVPGARPLREDRSSVRWWLDGVGEQVMLAGVRSPTEGVRELRLPGDDWVLRTVAGGRDGAHVRSVSGDTDVALSLPSLGFGGVIAHRPLAEAPPLAIEAVIRGDDVVVDVRNAGAQRLDDVEVRIGAARRPVGAIDAGATAAATFAADALPQVSQYTSVTTVAGHDATADSMLAEDLLAPEPGVAWAIGTVVAPGTPDDGASVVVGARPTVGGDALLTPLAIDRTLVDGADRFASGTFQIEGGDGILRLRLPAGLTAASLEDRLGDNRRLEVWDWRAEAWSDREEAFAGGVGAADRLLSPTGELYVRNTGGNRFDFATSSVGEPPAGAQEEGATPAGDATPGEDGA